MWEEREFMLSSLRDVARTLPTLPTLKSLINNGFAVILVPFLAIPFSLVFVYGIDGQVDCILPYFAP